MVEQERARELRALGCEGSKTDGVVGFANSDPRMVALFLRWPRRFFTSDEGRLRVALHLHAGLDLPAAQCFWSEVTAIPVAPFQKPYRAAPTPRSVGPSTPWVAPRCCTTAPGRTGE